MIARRVSTSKRNRSLIWGGLLLVVLLAAALAYANRHTPMPVAKVTPTTLPNAHTNDTATHAGPSNDTTPAPTVTPSNPTRPSAATLAAPTGPYLNTHSMSLSNGSTMMDSTCGGPEGATCVIVATRNGQSVTVSDGKPITGTGVELVWDAKKLTPGTWEVRAVASKDGQTAQSPAESLVVTP